MTGKQAVTFAIGFGLMMIVWAIGTRAFVRHRETGLSQAATMNCFIYRQGGESC
jgi:hypothetical protein